MEYVCRVGTPSGEVVERTFSAPDERSLRADLEQQGYYLLGVRRGLGLSLLRLRPRRVDPGLLLIFAQELAALLKASGNGRKGTPYSTVSNSSRTPSASSIE